MLFKTLKEDLKTAILTKDAIRKDVLRTLIGEASNKVSSLPLDKIEARRAEFGEDGMLPTDAELVALIKKFVDDAKLSQQHGSVKAAEEILVLEAYMPKQLNSEQLAAEIAKIVAGLPERSPKVMGKVMADLKAAHGGTYDGKLASELVKKALAT